MARLITRVELTREQDAALNAYVQARTARDPDYKFSDDHRRVLMRFIKRKDLAAIEVKPGRKPKPEKKARQGKAVKS